MPEISSRISCVACCGSFSKTNSTMMLPKLSSELEVMRSTPLMPEITSSIGSITSRSTTSGDAPGYGMATTTIGASISGNSSVSSCASATMPNTTRIIIATTVRTGRVIAVSEMNINQCCIKMSTPQTAETLRRGEDGRLLRHIHLHWRAGCDALGRAAQQHVSFVQSRRHLHTFGTRIAQPERDGHLLGLAVAHA